MYSLTFINAINQQVKFELKDPYWLISFTEKNDANIVTQKAPNQDGDTFINSSLEPKYISIEFEIFDEAISKQRSYISSVFNPKHGPGLLIYEDGDVKKEIFGTSEHVPTFPSGNGNRTSMSQKGIIDLVCHNPYWITDEQIDQLVVWEGGLEFPLQLPTFFAQQSQSKAKILVNEGDVDTPVFVKFNGPATAPIRVINVTTGEFIEVNQDLLAGESLEINTAFGQKRVSKVLADGTVMNAFHFINLESTFFQLIPGNNLIDYSTGADYERAGVTITWRNRYLGV